MSRNVELLRRAIEAYNVRDVDAFLAFCDPSVEIHSVFAAVGGGVYHGHNGVRKLFADLEDAWGSAVRLEPEAFFDLGEHTVVFYVMHGRGQRSGVEAAMPVGLVARWRDGLVVYFKAYIHREDALRDLGASEDELERIDPVTTSANVDLVRSIYADWERGDFSSAEWADANIELVVADGPDPGSWRGLGGMAEGARDLFRAWEGVMSETEGYRELDGERVLVLDRRRGRGKTSGLELGRVRTGGATLWQLHDGRVTKLVIYFDRDRAFADLGLSPETDSSAA